MGNHLDLLDAVPAAGSKQASDTWQHFDYKTSAVRNVIIHSKNDRSVLGVGLD